MTRDTFSRYVTAILETPNRADVIKQSLPSPADEGIQEMIDLSSRQNG